MSGSTLVKSRLVGFPVTDTQSPADGSIAIDQSWMDAVGLVAGEKVEIFNSSQSDRITTFVTAAPAGSKTIALRDTEGQDVDVGDKLVIVAYESVYGKKVVEVTDEHALKSLDFPG